MTEGQPVLAGSLVEELVGDVRRAGPLRRRCRLRCAGSNAAKRCGSPTAISSEVQPVDTVARQISYVADAIVEAAVEFARRQLEEQHGRTAERATARRAALSCWRSANWAAIELNYSSDIDLVFFYEQDGQTDARRTMTNQEYFERLLARVNPATDRDDRAGHCLPRRFAAASGGLAGPTLPELRPDACPTTTSRAAPGSGRPIVKARPIAGDSRPGHELLARLEPWIYRRYLSLADITGIKALKRRIEQRAEREGADVRNVKTGHGGIRDIEFVIQFLQLSTAAPCRKSAPATRSMRSPSLGASPAA